MYATLGPGQQMGAAMTVVTKDWHTFVNGSANRTRGPHSPGRTEDKGKKNKGKSKGQGKGGGGPLKKPRHM